VTQAAGNNPRGGPESGAGGGAGSPAAPGVPALQAIPAASGMAELGAEFRRSRSSYGEGALVACDRLVRIYAADGIEVQALQGLDLLVYEGELTAMVGASGSGKSTLMNILAGLDAPTAGSVRVAGHDLAAMSPRERVSYRRTTVGFIWQQTSRNLLPYLTALQNVIMPMRLSGMARRKRAGRATELLEVLGVGYCASRKPEQMSGGEQQRTAIATALANDPHLLLADEPTGELDSATARDVFAALQAANAELGVTVLVVTHDPAVSAQVRRTIAIRDGRTSTETLRHATSDEQGNDTHHAVEYAVLDRAGRLQLPREMIEPLAMRDRVRLEAEPDHIGVWPDDRRRPGEVPGGQAGTEPGERPQGRHRSGGTR
jgi:ABC-type lipoprotein export system ATPase subunit